jgi:predicted Rossmann-fold nucleotide-binding protein
VLTSEVLVILPGGAGTASEASLARKFGRPAITMGLRREGFPHAETTSATLEFVRRTLGLS